MELGAYFSCRAFCNAEVTDKCVPCLALISLGNIAHNAYRSPADLIFESEVRRKSAAVWSDNPMIAATQADTCTEGNDVFDIVPNTGALLTTMKMPSGKEILAGVPAQSPHTSQHKCQGKEWRIGNGDRFWLSRGAHQSRQCRHRGSLFSGPR
jgi:hypothetical protein